MYYSLDIRSSGENRIRFILNLLFGALSARVCINVNETFEAQSTYIPRVPQCLSPRWNWDHLTSSPASECVMCIPPSNQREDRLTCGWGVGESQIRTTGEKAEQSVYLCFEGKIIFFLCLGTRREERSPPCSVSGSWGGKGALSCSGRMSSKRWNKAR